MPPCRMAKSMTGKSKMLWANNGSASLLHLYAVCESSTVSGDIETAFCVPHRLPVYASDDHRVADICPPLSPIFGLRLSDAFVPRCCVGCLPSSHTTTFDTTLPKSNREMGGRMGNSDASGCEEQEFNASPDLESNKLRVILASGGVWPVDNMRCFSLRCSRACCCDPVFCHLTLCRHFRVTTADQPARLKIDYEACHGDIDKGALSSEEEEDMDKSCKTGVFHQQRSLVEKLEAVF
ncbi:hypothetical protein MVEN_01434300 [Mycena venus]|uniref:Uncharacterized protein n=1 Tax=Mycena venus TaxID=2733690 RepID=A0A8H7CV36_9AGAR|nr:hypothetical protein MVEN_01434300 [Mycena venus]